MSCHESPVAPYAGAWIEILSQILEKEENMSRPTRARGLKCSNVLTQDDWLCVAPYAGAWIEMA